MPQSAPRIDGLDLEQLVHLRNAVDRRIGVERQRLQSLLDRAEQALEAEDVAPIRRPSGVRAPLGRRRIAAGRGRRGRRGEGWAIVEKALRGMGGKGTTADLKSAWVGRATPLSVAMISYVKSGKLKKTGSGRGAVYSLTGHAAVKGATPKRRSRPTSAGTSAS